MKHRLENKAVTVTGGATGIGEAISKKFADESAVVAGFPDDPADKVVNEIIIAIAFKGELSIESVAHRKALPK